MAAAFGSALAIVSVFGSHKGKARGIVGVLARSREKREVEGDDDSMDGDDALPPAWSLLQ